MVPLLFLGDSERTPRFGGGDEWIPASIIGDVSFDDKRCVGYATEATLPQISRTLRPYRAIGCHVRAIH